MKNKIKNTIIVLLMVLGSIGFFSGLPLSMGIGNITGELPWGDVGNMVVDEEGNIYLGLQFYGRIQSYDIHGKFRKQWNIGSAGNFRLKINEKQQVEVATAKGNGLSIFDKNGKLLKESREAIDYDDYMTSTRFSYRVSDGSVYTLNNMLLIPTIDKKEINKEEITLVYMPWYLFLIEGPFPAFIFFFVGLLVSIFFKDKKEENKNDNA